MSDPVNNGARKKKILFVCMGNICRSPAAEGVMRALAEQAGVAAGFEISSAGTIGMHAGELPDARMRAAAIRRGYELRSRARQITRDDLDVHDLVLVMDEDNRRNVLALARTEAQRGRVKLFCEYCREHDARVVPDPYYGGDAGFELVLDLLEDGCRGIIAAEKG